MVFQRQTCTKGHVDHSPKRRECVMYRYPGNMRTKAGRGPAEESQARRRRMSRQRHLKIMHTM